MNPGQLVCGGFQGTTVTSHASRLIVDYHVQTIIISRKNTVNVKQTTKLLCDLQWLAFTQGGYKHPIMFCLDEEGGMMNSLFDEEFLTQFPSAMALSATHEPELVYYCAKAMAVELRRIGFSIILGPVLDVITKLSHQLVGVRSFAPTIADVTKYGAMCAKGLQDGGLITVGKHFPGIGNAAVDSLMELPMMADSLDQIRQFNSVPFATLINDGLLDGISAAGCGVPTISPDETHACLSPVLLTQLLRHELKFDGFVISECLEMDALYHSIGLSQGVILALLAGCDLVLVCQDEAFQREALDAIRKGIENGTLEEEIVQKSVERIQKLQERLPQWSQIFPNNERGPDPVPYKIAEPEEWQRHKNLSQEAYRKSITLIRDYNDTLPLVKFLPLPPEEPANILLLSPLLNPLYPSKHVENEPQQTYTGEEVFQHFGDLLANHPINRGPNKLYNVLHTTYTANGLTQLHESLISRSKIVIVLTSEASRNMYQIGIVKYVSILCGASPAQLSSTSSQSQLSKPVIIVATSSPYDFFYNKSIGSAYLCCYDYSNNALDNVVRVLMGDLAADGCIPGEEKFKKRTPAALKKTPRRWLVDEFDVNRDWSGLLKLWKTNASEQHDADLFECQSEGFYKRVFALLMPKSETTMQRHFVVRNSSLNILYGMVITWVDGDVGKIVYILVDKSKRLQSIGKNLYARAIRYLVKERGCSQIEMGSSFPLLQTNNTTNSLVRTFLTSLNWHPDANSDTKYIMALGNMQKWQVPKKVFRELMIVGVRFDICQDATKLESILADTNQSTNLRALYQEAISHLNTNGVKIVIALEPTNQSVIGSIVLFTNKSQISKFFPFIDDCAQSTVRKVPSSATLHSLTNDNQSSVPLVGGIAAPIVDSSYSNLTEIFKYGLICSGITLLKQQGGEGEVMDQCVIIGVSEGKMKQGVSDIGFSGWKAYHDNFGVKSAVDIIPAQ